MKSFFSGLIRFVMAVVVLAGLGYLGGRLFLFDVAQVEGKGMLPTLGPGAYVMSWKRAEPRRGDIVLFVRDGEFRARRVVALAGETVAFDDFALVVDGTPASYEERYQVEVGGRRATVLRESLLGQSHNVMDIVGRRMKGQPKATVEDGYYVLSDNREVGISGDSRQLGVIERSEIRGVVRWILEAGERPAPVVDEPLTGTSAEKSPDSGKNDPSKAGQGSGTSPGPGRSDGSDGSD